MSFLFGDLQPSPFETNYLEVLRDTIELAAAIAEADQEITTAGARTDALRAAADAEGSRLERLAVAMLAATGTVDQGAPDSPTASLAKELAEIVSERHQAATAKVDAQLAADIRAVEARAVEAGSRYRAALEAFLLVRDPPDSTSTIRLVLAPRKEQKETRHEYEAESTGRSEIGLEWTVALAIPDASPWAKPLRLDQLGGSLSILTPQKSGLIKREVKLKKQKLDRWFVTKLVDDGTTVSIELRAELDEEEGLDISVDYERLVTAARTGEEGDATVGPFAVDPDDKATLIELAAKLRAAARELPRKKLALATFDGGPFDGTDPEMQPKLVLVVTRVVERIAPIASEIASRSRAEDELVLRRVLADTHREEIFLPKATLREKLTRLDAEHRALFDALPLEAAPPGSRRTIDSAPPPSVRSEVPPSSSSLRAAAPSEPEPEPDEGDDLVATLKHINAMTKDGRVEESYRQYASLFASPSFAACKAEHQRRALELMIRAKSPPAPSDEVREAHRAALGALQALVLEHRDPADYELLGMAYVVLDEPAKATEIFKKALEIERARNPGSDLCGNLMRRVSQL